MQSVHDSAKRNFLAARYMDDILLFYADSLKWDKDAFLSQFQSSECYMPPLKLEPGHDGTFLETEFAIKGGYIQHWLKNANAKGGNKVWRYHHINSYIPFSQKRATLISTLKKVDGMASDDAICFTSANDKLQEFMTLHYPNPMLKYACLRVGRETGRKIWFAVAKRFV